MAASVGWLREVLVPGSRAAGRLCARTPNTRSRLRYRAGSSNVAFTSGAAPAGPQTRRRQPSRRLDGDELRAVRQRGRARKTATRSRC